MIEIREYIDDRGRSPFGRWFDTLIVLLGGGTKVRQQRDIEDARELWQEYKRRKHQEV